METQPVGASRDLLSADACETTPGGGGGGSNGSITRAGDGPVGAFIRGWASLSLTLLSLLRLSAFPVIFWFFAVISLYRAAGPRR
jgi:hypothetical protein